MREPAAPLFRVVTADPPWRFDNRGNRASPDHNRSAGGRRAAASYETMDLDGVRALRVPDVLLPEALLLLWAPWVMVLSGAAVSVADAWGFQPKTVVPWVKGRLDVDGLRVQIGMGNYVRCCTEALLVCTRGGLRVPPADRPAGVLPLRSGPESLGILAPRGRHSEKPELARDLAEALSDGPYLELFARTLRPGWSAWGNEAPVPDPRLVGLL